MTDERVQPTRRTVLAGSAGLAVIGTMPGTGASAAAATANPAGLRLLNSTEGVNVPPRAEGVMKFSYPWPEPSVDFAGLTFAFEVVTYDNRYAVDPATVVVERTASGLRFKASGLTWAGGQEPARGSIDAQLTRSGDGAIEWVTSATAPGQIKAIRTIVRGLPRGELSASAGAWHDYGDDEKIFEYPALMAGMATPLLAIRAKDGRVWGISSLQRQVRPARFFLWPGADGYKLELSSEMPAWDKRSEGTAQVWRIMPGGDFASVAAAHFAHVRSAWSIPAFATRSDAPEWMRHIALTLSLHGQHWSGRIFNDYDRQREILRWAAQRINPRNVLVFLAGWDGRYYWDYPAFQPDARMGGEAGFRRLIEEGHRLGFRFLLMFGSNVANPASPLFPGIADAQLRDPYGQTFSANYVDWDGDQKGDASMAFMNLAVESWRRHLTGRIDDMIGRYGLDAYFLDIGGLWENNPQGDIHEGMRTMVADLAKRHPGVPAVSEMQYDAQMAFIPMSHVPRYSLYPQANYEVVASFDHLSHPAPGSGSTGVHEYGYSTYKPVTLEQREIPTISFSHDTLARYADLAARDIATANARFEARGRRT